MERFLNKDRLVLDTVPKGWNIVCQDESIFVYDGVIRSVWALKGSKPRVKITGFHKKMFVFGLVSLDGRQLFRQYSQMNASVFLKYLKCLRWKFKKFILFYGGTPWHRTKEINEFFEEYKDCILPIRFPKCSLEFNPLEECCRQGKNDITGSVSPFTFEVFKHNISEYYRTKRFKLDIIKYLCQ